MANLFYHLFFWSTRPLAPAIVPSNNIGTHIYHDKSSGVENVLMDCNRKWTEDRGISWTLKNRRPERLRDTLQECEDLLASNHVACMKWRTPRSFQIVLSNGVMISFLVAWHSGDVEKIIIEKSLTARLHGTEHTIRSGILLDYHMILLFSGDPQVGVVYAHHTPLDQSELVGKKSHKSHDLKVSFCDVPGSKDPSLERKLAVNTLKDLVVIWWPYTGDTVSNTHRSNQDWSNLVLLKLSSKVTMAGCTNTEHELVDVSFSHQHGHIIYTVEMVGLNKLQLCTYEYADKKIGKVYTVSTTITTPSPTLLCERSRSDDKLLIGCGDGSLLLFDYNAETVKKAKAYFAPISLIKWYPSGVFVFVCSLKGEIQCYDMALNQLKFQLASEEAAPVITPILEMGNHFMVPLRLEIMEWSSVAQNGEANTGCYDNLMFVFDKGPIGLLHLELGIGGRGRFGPTELISEYVRCKQLHESVVLLGGMNWNSQSRDCFACLTIITDYLLVQPLTNITEALIESALGTFLAPTKPLSNQVEKVYREPIKQLMRRFFRVLLSYRHLEKAYKLAVEVGKKDLLMELHFVASSCGEEIVAAAAKDEAKNLSSRGGMKASGSSDDDAGVFADIISAEALCLDILEDQSPDTNLSHNPFPDYKSISIPTPETVSSSSLSADGSSIDRVNIEQSDEEDGTTVSSMSNFNVSHFGHV
ncbi:WD repeat-containing and planar cell polarity effector protein fritz homolog [Dysidea avara]|uniref:WD repeat-containing and planar cell polarity effector protein fritz homolog n=1 Tax=Dysidea avara TaxID=196820 RepID=UPI00331C1695